MALLGFDATYYVQTYPDVLTAILQGKIGSAEEHFLKHGAGELRNPNANFDTRYYATNNPDVVTAVGTGAFANVYDHYIRNGGQEGRAPSAALAGFNGQAYLDANADVKASGLYTAANAVAHYVLYGAAEKRPGAGNTQQQVTGNYVGTTADDTVTPAGGQTNAVRVEGGQQGAGGDTLVITSGSAASFQVLDLSNTTGDQNRTIDAQNVKVGPVVQGFENVDASAATIGVNILALDRTSVTNTGGVASTITGSKILGGTSRDTLNGNNGNDSIDGGDGHDIINGGAGNDTLIGGAGNDTIDGGAGNDLIEDGAGDDVVTGGAGNDTINVGSGTNNIDGGAGNDTITLVADQATATTVSTVLGGAGNDTIVLNNTAITAASRVSVSGGAGNDTITAGLGVETVNGGSGNDTVRITAANLGASDIFRGNDGQDIIQLEIPTGSGTNTFVFQSLGTTAATSQFAGFEAIALIDSSGNTNPKQYKLILTDTFLANNLVNGSFLIDARGLPGGSNLVLDFSQLTAASSALFIAGAFRVLASPSTDVRDQNNNTITASYLVNTTNAALGAVAAFNVYAGETTIVAGTEAAYTADRLVNTGAGQAAYTTEGGQIETGTSVTSDFTLTSNTAILTNAFNSGATASNVNPTTGFLTSSSNSINAGTNLLATTLVVADVTTTDNDTLSALLTTANGTPTITNIETINLTSFGAGALTFTGVTGAKNINITGQSFAGTGLTAGTGTTIGLHDIATGGAVSLTAAAAGAATLTVSNVATALTLATYTSATIAATGTNTLSGLAAGGGASTYTVTGSGSLATSSANVVAINASAYTGTFSFTQTAGVDADITGGSGNDTFTFTGGFFTATDKVNGGAGADTLALSGATTAGLDNVIGVETVNLAAGSNYIFNAVAAASVHANDSTLVTINATALTAANTLTFSGANVSQHAYVVNGGAGNDTIVGSNLADTINGGAGNDIITGGLGGDIINVGTGTDRIAYTAAGETYSAATAAALNTSTTAGTLTALAGIDVITGLGAGDSIDLSGILNTFTGAAATTVAGATGVAVALVRGTWNAGASTFTQSATGADSLFVFDADGAGAAAVVNAAVLIGVTGAGTAATGVLTFA